MKKRSMKAKRLQKFHDISKESERRHRIAPDIAGDDEFDRKRDEMGGEGFYRPMLYLPSLHKWRESDNFPPKA